MIKNNEPQQEEFEIPLNNISDKNKDDNIDELLLKIYEKHIDLISLYAKTIQISQMVAYISTAISLIILAIRLCPFSSFNYSYLLIPILIAVFFLIITMNMYLMMKDLIDSAQKTQESSSINPGTVISYLCLNIIGLSIIIFISLALLRLDLTIESKWITIFIALFFGCCTALFFIIFISPAFVEKKLYFELAIMFIDIICVFAFGLLFSVKIDNDYNYSFGLIAIPLYFTLGLNGISLLTGLITKKTNNLSSILMLSSLVFFFLALILLQCKQDSIITNIDNWVEVVLVLIGFNCLFAESIYTLFFEQESLDYKSE